MKTDESHKYDYLLIITIAALLIIGLMMIYSATFALGYQLYDQPTYYFIRQLLWMGVGLLVMIIFARVEYHTWRRLSILLMTFTLLLLGVVLLVGQERFGGQRWLLNGSIQPSEFSKLAIIIYIADWLSSKGEQIRKVSYGLIPFAILLGLITGLIVLQRSLSTAVLIALTAIAMFFIAGGNLWQIIASGILGGGTIAFLTAQSAYRLTRVATFLDPLNADPLDSGYQIRQILIALGSGGLTGLGLGASRQKFGYIPASHTDGIFAILGEELGLIGSLAVLGLFGFLAYRGFRVAMLAPDSFGRVLASGITCSLIFQAIVNVGVVTASIPFTGVTLPFISFGGSSLVVTMASAGLLLAVSRRTMPEDPQEKEERREADHLRRRNRGPRLPGPGRRAKAKAVAR
ncbi:MAG: putative lipid II flippase FtsW [Anaerolineae bacterium]|nr:putative lipid II flippase FtsW [Anaerolineales bacterium]MCQ3976355.1 putative lipid II flippase FtsW [Anaerolineae bacterium]